MRESNKILKQIETIKERLEGKVYIAGDRELRAGDICDDGAVVDEGEHISIGGKIVVEKEPAHGEERDRLLQKLKELRELYDEAVKKEREEFIEREADRIAKEIEEKGTVTCYFEKEFQLSPDDAEKYYMNIGNLRMAEAIRKAKYKIIKEV